MGKRDPITNTDHLIAEGNQYLKGLSLGNISVSANKGKNSSVSSVNSSISEVQLLASNDDRVEASVYNDSTEDLYVKLGSGASTSSYTVKLFPDETLVIDRYTGVITGVWDAVNGSAKLTDILP